MAKEVQVLLLSSLADISTDRVCFHLAEMNITYLRLNRDQLSEWKINIDPVRALMTCSYDGTVWRVGANLRSIWWRQPTFLRNTPGKVLSLEEQLERSQWTALLRGFMLFDKALWFNRPTETYNAESKPLQLRLAAELGFYVPETRITNDANAPLQHTIGTDVALKSVDTLLLFEHERQHFGYTSIVSWSDCADEFLKFSPATIQKVITPKTDLRVTVVGSKLWCSQVTVSGLPIEGDWRLQEKKKLEYRHYDLPRDIRNLCLKLVQYLGLNFAAIDLAVSDGRYWFIEINPTGEWGWLDNEDTRISPAIAHALACAA